MKKEIFNRLAPLWDVVGAVEELMDENSKLRKENAYLRERVEWFENSLNENAKAAGKAMHSVIQACLDGRIKINDNNETVITPE